MLSKTDKLIREFIKKVGKRLSRILNRFSKRLDDPIWVLKNSQSRIDKEINAYIKSVMPTIKSAFTGKRIQPVIDDAVDVFEKELLKFVDDYKSNTARANRIGKSIIDNQSKLVQSIAQQVKTLQRQKTILMKSMDLQATSDTQNTIRISGKDYDADRIDMTWETLSREYGSSKQVQFESGKKMPLDKYVDGKLRTLTQDINNQVTVMESVNNDVPTVKISYHGSPDSCKVHENEIVFINELTKKRFIQENPKMKNFARKLNTLEAVRRDATHMFKFNCLHRITPYPIDLISPATLAKSTVGAPTPSNRKELKKINVA